MSKKRYTEEQIIGFLKAAELWPKPGLILAPQDRISCEVVVARIVEPSSKESEEYSTGFGVKMPTLMSRISLMNSIQILYSDLESVRSCLVERSKY